VHAQSNLLAFLKSVGVLEPDGRSDATARTAATAFAQLAWPWLRTVRSGDLPQSIEPADGLLAGLLARNALVRGTFRSVGGTVLDDVVGLVPLPVMGLGRDGPTPGLAERLCLIGPEPEGNTLLSDVTSSADMAWRPGGTSRLLGAILRSARRFGESHAFDPNGPALWARLTRSFESMLAAFWREGAFGGANALEAFEVRCDRGTMTQNDLDSGRLVAEITVLPAAAITRITVVLAMTLGETPRAEVREVA
jgi:phage tail sheath protein FI